MAGSRALATGLGPLVDRLGVAGRHAQPMAAERFGQRRPGGPSSCAAALTLPSYPARAKACSAPAQSIRNRLGCQPRWLCRDVAEGAGRLVPGQFSSLVPVGPGSGGVRGHGCAHLRLTPPAACQAPAAPCGGFTPTSQAWLSRPGPRASGADTSPGPAGGQPMGTQAVTDAGVTGWAGIDRRNSADSVAYLRCPAHPLAPKGAEFRGIGPAIGVTTPLPSPRAVAGRGGSGHGRPAQPGTPAADRQADHRPRSSGARWLPAGR
jgi:hypothetical protein